MMPLRLTFPLVLLAFDAVGIKYINYLFNTNTRWIALFFLAFILLLARAFVWMRARFAFILFVYCVWCLLTTFWSIVPELSLMKASACVFVILTFVSAGIFWGEKCSANRNELGYLFPIVLLTLGAGIFDRGSTSVVYENYELYQGLSGNPNYLGVLTAVSFAYAYYLAYWNFVLCRRGLASIYSIVSVALILALVVILWLTASRAAMLCVIVITLIAFAGLRPGRKLAFFGLIVTIGMGAITVLPNLPDLVYERLIVKYSATEDIFYTRRHPWQESFEAAQEGGLLGLGYGASAGFENFSGGFSANRYGREKANSQMAVWEETGLVGLGLYCMLLLSIFSELRKGIRLAQDGVFRFKISLVTGLALGLVVHSAFEAWWTSPGSAQSAVFWATIGVGVGLARKAGALRSRSYRQPVAMNLQPSMV